MSSFLSCCKCADKLLSENLESWCFELKHAKIMHVIQTMLLYTLQHKYARITNTRASTKVCILHSKTSLFTLTHTNTHTHTYKVEKDHYN